MRLLAICSALLVCSCSPFDQKSFDEGFENNQVDAYIVPTTVPVTEEEFVAMLHGSEKNEWVAQEFTLEGHFGFQDCRLDDTMVLRQDGTYHFDGGTVSCGGDDVSSKSGTYRIDYANKKLIFDEGTSTAIDVNVSGLDQGVIALDSKVSVFGVSMSIKGVYTVE